MASLIKHTSSDYPDQTHHRTEMSRNHASGHGIRTGLHPQYNHRQAIYQMDVGMWICMNDLKGAALSLSAFAQGVIGHRSLQLLSHLNSDIQ